MTSLSSYEPVLNIFITLFQVIGAIIIVYGGLRTVYYLLIQSSFVRRLAKPVPFEELLRLEFGQKIVFGLEFMIVGGILVTLKQWRLDDLYALGVLVLIRTIMSLFVVRDIKGYGKVKDLLAKSIVPPPSIDDGDGQGQQNSSA